MSSELTPGEIGRLQKKLLFEMLANVDLQRDNERLRERIKTLGNNNERKSCTILEQRQRIEEMEEIVGERTRKVLLDALRVARGFVCPACGGVLADGEPLIGYENDDGIAHIITNEQIDAAMKEPVMVEGERLYIEAKPLGIVLSEDGEGWVIGGDDE